MSRSRRSRTARRRRRSTQRAEASLALLASGCVTLGCAPSQSFRPAGALHAAHGHEVGLALSVVRPRPYVTEHTREVAQAWWTSRLGRSWLLSALLALDSSALAAGAALRRELFSARHVTAAAEVEGGFGWLALSVPAALWFTPELGLYCSPRLGNWGPALTPFVPCGVSVALPEGLALRAELQLAWADFEPFNRRVHWGFGVAHRF